MQLTLKAPIEPGTRHVFVLNPALLRGVEVIDYTVGPFILLHVSVRSQGQLVILNDRIGTAWREQVEMRLEAPSLRTIELSLLFHSLGVTVTLGGNPPLEFSRQVDIGEAERVVVPDAIHFTAFEPKPAPAALRLRRGTEEDAGADAAPAGGIDGADVQHVSGWFRAGDARPEALLLAVAGAPEPIRYPLDPQAPPGRVGFVAEFPAGLHPADGEAVTLALEAGGASLPLGRGLVRTAAAGGIDRVTSRLVGGWALNTRLDRGGLPVEILVNGKVVGSALSNRGRPDLRGIHPGLESAGFLYRLPERLGRHVQDGAEVTARIQGTEIPLADGPWPITRRPAPGGTDPRGVAGSGPAP